MPAIILKLSYVPACSLQLLSNIKHVDRAEAALGLVWLGLIWFFLALLGLAWLGLVWLGFVWRCLVSLALA